MIRLTLRNFHDGGRPLSPQLLKDHGFTLSRNIVVVYDPVEGSLVFEQETVEDQYDPSLLERFFTWLFGGDYARWA